MKIKIPEIAKDVKGTIAILEAVNNLPFELLFTRDEKLFVDLLFSVFDFEDLSDTSSEEKARIILDKAYIPEDRVHKGIPIMVNSSEVNRFLFCVLGFQRLPHEEFYRIYQKVSVDLVAMMELIEKYHLDRYIKAYLETGRGSDPYRQKL